MNRKRFKDMASMLPLVAGGGSRTMTRLKPPTPFVSDSFNRANGALGGTETDGEGDVNWPGGGGFEWTNQQSSVWSISSNRATPATVGTDGRAVVTVNLGLTDVVMKANLNGVGGGPGFVLRYEDANNFVVAYITSTTATLRKRVAGGSLQVVLSVTVPIVANGELLIKAEGTAFSLYYNRQFVGSATIADAALQTSTLHGLFNIGQGSTYNVDNFAIWTLAEYTRLRSFFAVLGLSVFREDANNFLVRLPIPGEGNLNVVAEWRFQLVQTALFIHGLRVVDVSGSTDPIILSGTGTAWESVLSLGAQGDVQGSFELVGNLHGNQSRTSVSIELDEADISTLVAGTYVVGDELVITQEINMIYPVDDTTVAGAVTLTHTLNIAGLHTLVERAFNSADDWEAYTYYGMMIPGANNRLNTYQIEGFSPALVIADGNFKQTGTEATWAELSDNLDHTYKVRMTLPSGEPSDAGWDDDAIKFGFQDRADGVIKAYAVAISTTFAERQAVAGLTFTHEAAYTVRKV